MILFLKNNVRSPIVLNLLEAIIKRDRALNMTFSLFIIIKY
jgi:hypothetical protein